MIEATRCDVVICDGEGGRALDAAGVTLDRLHLASIAQGGQLTARPAVFLSPESPAYALFTSGSTGHPKGVVQTHASMVHNVLRHRDLSISREDRVTLISSDGFVGAISNPYIALCNGATLAPRSFHQDGVFQMFDWLEESRVSVGYLFPSFLRQFAAVAPAGRSYPARLLYLGGETVHASDISLARQLFTGAEIAVGLNSTETGLTRLNRIGRDAPAPVGKVPLGGPVPGVEIEIFGDAGAILPPGEPGEITVKSAWVRPFYLDSGRLTDATEPIPGAAGLRRFRTGDRGYLTGSGLLFYVGRRDEMVKIRGHRVEIAEVEAALSAIPRVAEAAVTSHEDDSHDTVLSAFVVAKDATLDAAEIRRRLAATLPASMAPATVTLMPALPRTANGKVDRNALRSPDGQTGNSHDRGTGARSSGVTGRILEVWKTTLRASEIGVEENFFDLGGDSIKALKVVASLRKEFGVPLALQTLFEQPTISALAREVTRLLSRETHG